jgi:hypothetical protein
MHPEMTPDFPDILIQPRIGYELKDYVLPPRGKDAGLLASDSRPGNKYIKNQFTSSFVDASLKNSRNALNKSCCLYKYTRTKTYTYKYNKCI